MIFEWDPKKAASNLKKPGVSFVEALTVFNDDHALQFFDDEHSGEERFLMPGLSKQSRILVVVHCELEAGECIRIISAREATKPECQHYPGVYQ